jgi:hypothetical protein
MNDLRGYAYPGGELALFAHAENWKAYFCQVLRPYIGGRVAEIGAGIGSTTEVLCTSAHDVWYALEPDRELFAELTTRARDGRLAPTVQPVNGTVSALAGIEPVDTMLYIDVLEHIEDDGAELQRAASSLKPNGNLIVLSPAYQALYSPFDAAIGHHRRYTLKSLRLLTPPELELRSGHYLDSIGVCTSIANRLLLRQSQPTRSQVLFWDRYIVPCSRMFDRATAFRFGKSVVAVWRRR